MDIRNQLKIHVCFALSALLIILTAFTQSPSGDHHLEAEKQFKSAVFDTHHPGHLGQRKQDESASHELKLAYLHSRRISCHSPLVLTTVHFILFSKFDKGLLSFSLHRPRAPPKEFASSLISVI